ncbi:MAG: hypothetical protein NVV73_18630 [Cellvibrionaceae bacterium]|nr:hypothetical protein [Cellvibrionaceae bacterium]
MSNIAGKSYAMNVITPVRRWCVLLNLGIFFPAKNSLNGRKIERATNAIINSLRTLGSHPAQPVSAPFKKPTKRKTQIRLHLVFQQFQRQLGAIRGFFSHGNSNWIKSGLV